MATNPQPQFDDTPVDGPHTYGYIGQRFGISDEEARRICNRALAKLRAHFADHGLTSTDIRTMFDLSSLDEERYLALIVERLAQRYKSSDNTNGDGT